MVMKNNGCMPFYEYYFEPTGKRSIIFFQFLHEDFEQGMKTKKKIEMYMYILSILIMILILVSIILFLMKKKYEYALYIVFLFFLLGLDNSLDVLCNQITHQKQFII
jgi:hypothetical protein